MTRRKVSTLILLVAVLLLIGRAVVYAQGERQTANLQIDGMV